MAALRGAGRAEEHMRRAVAESAEAVKDGAMPFGAVLVGADGRELLAARNACVSTGVRGGGADVTRHAEMELVRKMCGSDGVPAEARRGCTLYTSTEPCVMCAGAIFWSGVGRVVYGCSAKQLEGVAGHGGFDVPVRELYAMSKTKNHEVAVEGPLLADEALAVHRASGCWGSSAAASAADDIALERSLLSSGLGAQAVGDAALADAVPVIDMSRPDEEVAADLWAAASGVGFFTIVNHGIPEEMLDGAFAASAEYFAQPKERKEADSPFARELNSGYEYMAQVRPSTGTADQKESLQITARQGCMDGRWPTSPASFRSTAEELTAAAHALGQRLVGLLEPKACPHVEPGTLAKSHSIWGADGQCTLRFLHYLPLAEEALRELTGGDGPMHWRAGPHTDWDCVTLLFQRPGQPGLECCANPRADSSEAKQWIAVPPIAGGITINIGDMLARWSDGRLFSNLHRVRMPTPEECSPPSSRYSIAFFLQADKSALIEARESENITAGDYILGRIKSNFSK